MNTKKKLIQLGDLICSATDSVRVEKIIHYTASRKPFLIYVGPRYTKRGTLYKNESRIGIPQFDVKKIIPGCINEN